MGHGQRSQHIEPIIIHLSWSAGSKIFLEKFRMPDPDNKGPQTASRRSGDLAAAMNSSGTWTGFLAVKTQRSTAPHHFLNTNDGNLAAAWLLLETIERSIGVMKKRGYCKS